MATEQGLESILTLRCSHPSSTGSDTKQGANLPDYDVKPELWIYWLMVVSIMPPESPVRIFDVHLSLKKANDSKYMQNFPRTHVRSEQITAVGER
jgi:hypothetical protein